MMFRIVIVRAFKVILDEKLNCEFIDSKIAYFTDIK